MPLHPYLFFSGTCREAMTRYHEVFGGHLEMMDMTSAPEGETMPGTTPDMIMHAALVFEDGTLLMASDDPSGDGSGAKGVSISIALTDEGDARRIFEALADGGTIDMPLEATFWSPLFGSCVDRFGVSWMVDLEATNNAGDGAV